MLNRLSQIQHRSLRHLNRFRFPVYYTALSWPCQISNRWCFWYSYGFYLCLPITASKRPVIGKCFYFARDSQESSRQKLPPLAKRASQHLIIDFPNCTKIVWQRAVQKLMPCKYNLRGSSKQSGNLSSVTNVDGDWDRSWEFNGRKSQRQSLICHCHSTAHLLQVIEQIAAPVSIAEVY